MPRKRLPTTAGMQPGSNQQLPASAPTGMPYGERKESMDAQAAMPMGGGGAVPPPMEDPGPVQPLDFNSVPSVLDDSEFPDEPITTGLSIGAGMGPESMVRPTAGRVASTLDMLAGMSDDPSIRQLAEIAKAQGV